MTFASLGLSSAGPAKILCHLTFMTFENNNSVGVFNLFYFPFFSLHKYFIFIYFSFFSWLVFVQPWDCRLEVSPGKSARVQRVSKAKAKAWSQGDEQQLKSKKFVAFTASEKYIL